MYKKKITSLTLILAVLIGLSPAFCGELVDIGDNRKIYMECAGSGSPTVVLVAGYRDRGDAAWETLPTAAKDTPVFTAVSKFTRVCMYDRPGTISAKEETFEKSRSDPLDKPFTAKSAATDLHALLTAAKIQGPYVIVGHSMGGLITRLYTAMFPKDICGLVLIDGTTEDLRNRWTPEQWQIFADSIKAIPPDLAVYKDLETIDIQTSFHQMLDASMVALWQIPTTLLTADQVPDAKLIIQQGLWPASMTQESANQILKSIQASQANLASLFKPHAKHIENTHSGHYIQKEKPQLVIDAIRERVNNAKCKP